MRRLHVVGCHRSGTTLMFELLAACFQHDARCEHEKTIFNPPDDPQANLYLSKKPSDITHIHQIFRSDPNLFLIYLLRDPRSVITSIHPSKADVYFSNFARWQRYEAAATKLKAHPRFIQVRYEELVTSPDHVQATIEEKFKFLARCHPFSDFHQLSQASEPAKESLGGLRRIGSDRVANWKHHLPRIKYQLRMHSGLADAVLAYGYEANRDWLSLLENISEKSQQYGEDKVALWKQWETNLRYWVKSQRYLKRVKKES